VGGQAPPHALEWEKAARGADGRTYPGETRPIRVAPMWPPRTMPVTAFAAAESPFRTINMTGNVWEFADD